MLAAQRVVAVVLAASGLYAGLWAATTPRSFYDSFLGLHRAWVSVDGPFNEHLVRDVGAALVGPRVGAAVGRAARCGCCRRGVDDVLGPPPRLPAALDGSAPATGSSPGPGPRTASEVGGGG